MPSWRSYSTMPRRQLVGLNSFPQVHATDLAIVSRPNSSHSFVALKILYKFYSPPLKYVLVYVSYPRGALIRGEGWLLRELEYSCYYNFRRQYWAWLFVLSSG